MPYRLNPDYTFEDVVRRRILHDRVNVDEVRLRNAVNEFQWLADSGHRSAARDLAVLHYGQTGEQAARIKANKERRERYQKRLQDARRRRAENYRACLYKSILFDCPPMLTLFTDTTSEAIRQVEGFILSEYGYLDALPPSIVRRLDKLQKEKQAQTELAADPMERILSGKK